MLPKVGKTYTNRNYISKPIFVITKIIVNERYYQIDTKTVIGYPNIIHLQLSKKQIEKTWNKWFELIPDGVVLAKMI